MTRCRMMSCLRRDAGARGSYRLATVATNRRYKSTNNVGKRKAHSAGQSSQRLKVWRLNTEANLQSFVRLYVDLATLRGRGLADQIYGEYSGLQNYGGSPLTAAVVALS